MKPRRKSAWKSNIARFFALSNQFPQNFSIFFGNLTGSAQKLFFRTETAHNIHRYPDLSNQKFFLFKNSCRLRPEVTASGAMGT